MSRIKLLIVAALVGAAYGSYLNNTGKREVEKVRASAEKQLTSAQAAMTPTLRQVTADQLAAAKTLGANVEIAQAFDDANKPTAAALEVAVSALSKVAQPEAAKPDLLVLISGGAAARYRVGATNRFDKDDSAFKMIGPVGEAHGLTAMLDGEAFQIAAAPLALTGDPAPAPIGQIMVGYSLNDAFAMRLSKAAGVDVSIIADKKLIASTLPPLDKKTLPTSARAGASVDFGDLSGDRFSFYGLTKLPLGVSGAAAQHAIAISLGGDSVAVLSARVVDGYADVAADQKDLIQYTAGIILLCFIFMLFGSNATKGLAEVASVADKIAQGDLSLRAPTENLASDVRRLAVAVNAITANAATRRGSPSGPALGSTLSPPKPPEEKPLEPPRQSAPVPAPEPAKTTPPPPPPETKPDFREPSFSGLFGSSPSQVIKAAPARRDEDFGDIFDSQPPPPTSPPKPLMQPPPPPAPAAPAAGVQPMFQEDPDAFNPDATVVAQVPEALVRATRTAASQSSHQSSGRESIPMAVPLPSPPSANPEETHFQSVYREFVATRERCGEAADGLTYDKFVAKLRKNKDQLVAKYACKSVKFQVYVKDGKAALKATPVRE
jgi:hypothetical protein